MYTLKGSEDTAKIVVHQLVRIVAQFIYRNKDKLSGLTGEGVQVKGFSPTLWKYQPTLTALLLESQSHVSFHSGISKSHMYIKHLKPVN